MKSLKILQTLSKIAKILSQIVFVFSIVGAAFCAVGILSLAFTQSSFLVIGGISIKGIIEQNTNMNIQSVCMSMLVGFILCAGEAVVSKFANIYFKNELKAETPFTFEGAKEIMRLGIITIVVPTAAAIINTIIYETVKLAIGGLEPMKINNGSSIALGVMFLILSVVFKYGAEVLDNQNKAEE